MNDMLFSERLQSLRKERGITIYQLASSLGIMRATIYRWECGKTFPKSEDMERVADFFGVPVDYFYSKEYQQKSQNEEILQQLSKIQSDIKTLADQMRRLQSAVYYLIKPN